MTYSDSRHYEFFLTQAKVDQPIKPPEGDWVLLHVVSDAADTAGTKGSALIVWSRQKKH